MQKIAKTAAFLGLVVLALWAGTSFASAADVDWARDAGGLLGGTLALALATLITLAMMGGWRAALRFMAGTLAISWLAEVIGSKGGWLFGSAYRYHPGLHPVLPGGVPLFIPFAWVVLAGLPVLLLRNRKTTRPDGSPDPVRIFSKAAWSALGMVACDLALDPVAVSLGLWTWALPGPYFGVPWLNFAGWGAVAFLIFLVGYGWTGLGRAPAACILLRHELAWGLAHTALLVLLGFGVFHRTGSGGPLWAAMSAMSPLGIVWLNQLHGRIQSRRRRRGPGRTGIGH